MSVEKLVLFISFVSVRDSFKGGVGDVGQPAFVAFEWWLHVPDKNIVKLLVSIPNVAIYRSFIVNLVSLASSPVPTYLWWIILISAGDLLEIAVCFSLKSFLVYGFKIFLFFRLFPQILFISVVNFFQNSSLFEKSVTIVMKFFKILLCVWIIITGVYC